MLHDPPIKHPGDVIPDHTTSCFPVYLVQIPYALLQIVKLCTMSPACLHYTPTSFPCLKHITNFVTSDSPNWCQGTLCQDCFCYHPWGPVVQIQITRKRYPTSSHPCDICHQYLVYCLPLCIPLALTTISGI